MTTVADQKFIPFALPDIGDAEVAAVCEVLKGGWLTTGPRVRQFEKSFAEFVGARHAVAVNSCTAALHLALEAVGTSQNSEVITTPYTFAATAEVIRYFGAKPVFVDVDRQTLNIRPDLVGRAITNRTAAVIPVHVGGQCVDMDALVDVCNTRRVPIIEDAAHAFPAWYRGKAVGSIGNITCFSFYATKTISTGEGGMICTDDSRWAERCQIMALHGISRDAWKRYTHEGTWKYEIVAPGYKYNLTDIAAAIGVVQLARANEMAERRRQIAARYDAAFSALDQLEIPTQRAGDIHPWHLYMLRLHLDRLTIDRAQFIEQLKQCGIGASVHFIPLHTHPYYRELYGYSEKSLPVAYEEYLRELSLPIYSRMDSNQVSRVIDAVTDIVKRHAR